MRQCGMLIVVPRKAFSFHGFLHAGELIFDLRELRRRAIAQRVCCSLKPYFGVHKREPHLRAVLAFGYPKRALSRRKTALKR